MSDAEAATGGLPVQTSIRAHDHAVCVIDDEAGLARALGAFVEDGVARREVSVFVHAFPDEATAWELLRQAVEDAATLRDARVVLVSLYREVFERQGRIDLPFALAGVEAVVEDARRRGHAGARVFVDASRVYLADARRSEWFDFEQALGRRLHHAVGLVCAYRREQLREPATLASALRAHAYRFEAGADAAAR